MSCLARYIALQGYEDDQGTRGIDPQGVRREIAINPLSIQALCRSQTLLTETDKGLKDCREKLEQGILEFATGDTRGLLERLLAAREAPCDKGYELAFESGL
jgi:hypothetical protein